MNKSPTAATVAATLDERVAEIQAGRLLTVYSELHAALALLPSGSSSRRHLTRAIAELETYGCAVERQLQEKRK